MALVLLCNLDPVATIFGFNIQEMHFEEGCLYL